MSGQEPTRRATMGAAAPVKRADMQPTILVPTPAQLARGQCVIEASQEQWPSAVRQLAAKAEKHGWTVRTTYSQILDIPTVAGRHKGERQIRHYLAVRLEHRERGILAYGMWCGTDDSGWKADHAQAMLVNHWPTTVFGVVELGKLVTGQAQIKEVTGGYRLETVAHA